MRHCLLIACVSAGCVGNAPGGGDDMQPDGGGVAKTCPFPATTADTGAMVATKAELCNVPGSMGAQHWYKLSASIAGSMNYVEVNLYDKVGAFAGVAVHTGTFPVETAFGTCGVCVRGLADKGAATAKEYVAIGGSVMVTALGPAGQPISATLSNVTFAEVNASHSPVSNGCTAAVTAAKIDGTVVQVGGTGGGGAGGGGGGGGMCATAIGD
jgi:hypothetical protein